MKVIVLQSYMPFYEDSSLHIEGIFAKTVENEKKIIAFLQKKEQENFAIVESAYEQAENSYMTDGANSKLYFHTHEYFDRVKYVTQEYEIQEKIEEVNVR